MAKRVIVNVDGGSRGNPGPAAIELGADDVGLVEDLPGSAGRERPRRGAGRRRWR